MSKKFSNKSTPNDEKIKASGEHFNEAKNRKSDGKNPNSDSMENMENEKTMDETPDNKPQEETNQKINEEIFKKMEQILQEQKKQYETKIKLCEEKMKEMHIDKLTSLEQQKKQYLLEIETVKKYALQKFVEDLLTVADTLKMASIATWDNYEKFMDGLNMTINIFMNTLSKYHVEEIPTKVGDIFDESIHECLATSGEGNNIVQILKPGYKYGERVIRATQVIVGAIQKK